VWLLVLVGEILNLVLLPRLGGDPVSTGPLVSIVVPGRNEETAIESTIRRLLAQDYPNIEVIVVDDQSTDRTGEILARLAAESPSLIVVAGRPTPPGWLGKPWAVQQGIEASRGELLLLCDADVVYDPSVVSLLVSRFIKGDVGAIAVLPRFEVDGFWEATMMPMLPFVFLALSPAWLSNRTRIPILGVGGGPGTMVSREAWARIGGHQALRHAVVDDISLVRRVRSAGYRSITIRGEKHVSIRMYRGLREIIQGFTKNVYFALGGTPARALFVLAAAFIFHIGPYLLALSGVISLVSGSAPAASELAGIAAVLVISIVRLILFLDIGYRADHAILGHPVMMLGWIWIGLRSAWTVGIRRRLDWRGRRYDSAGTRFGD